MNYCSDAEERKLGPQASKLLIVRLWFRRGWSGEGKEADLFRRLTKALVSYLGGECVDIDELLCIDTGDWLVMIFGCSCRKHGGQPSASLCRKLGDKRDIGIRTCERHL